MNVGPIKNRDFENFVLNVCIICEKIIKDLFYLKKILLFFLLSYMYIKFSKFSTSKDNS